MGEVSSNFSSWSKVRQREKKMFGNVKRFGGRGISRGYFSGEMQGGISESETCPKNIS
jgi:hypothetical protein